MEHWSKVEPNKVYYNGNLSLTDLLDSLCKIESRREPQEFVCFTGISGSIIMNSMWVFNKLKIRFSSFSYKYRGFTISGFNIGQKHEPYKIYYKPEFDTTFVLKKGTVVIKKSKDISILLKHFKSIK